MGSFSSKDSHGATGAHGDVFHTPPASPQSDVSPSTPAVTQRLHPTSPRPPPAAPASVLSAGGKKAQPGSTCASSGPAPAWRPRPPVGSDGSPDGVGPLLDKPAGVVGRNGCPPASTPRPLAPQEKTEAVGPTEGPPSQCGASPVVDKRKERDSGLSQSILPAEDSQELEKLLEESRATLGITGSQDTAEILKRLLTEVKSLKRTFQAEHGEWLQFQADLQVAVSVADRLRAEAEEELAALRASHKDVERELAASQQRLKEADMQLVNLTGELKESRQRLAAVTQEPCQEPQRSNGEATSRESLTKNSVSEEARTEGKGVAKRYLRNVTNEGRSGEEVRSSETRRTVTTERTSLSRLPASSPATQNGTSQPNAASVGPINKNLAQLRGRRSLDWQESRSSADAGKREESLNKYNSALSELPPTKSQDGFNLLLRRHGGSKRNSLLRWCQSRTQGYKNIDITNFSSSWADGLAFCAVYHTYLPSHVPYSSLAPDNKRDNLSLAFKTGDAVGIAQTLTVEEMLRSGGPDWQRVLSYVESIYRHFEM